jgi:hypothetical protein
MMAKNDMKKNVGEASPRNKSDVTGNDSGLASSGMLGKGVNRDSSTERFAGNYSGLVARENYGSGPRSTKALRQPGDHGKSVTFDAYREAPATASGKKPNEGPFTHLAFGNPDKINVGNK